ncbi:hypothetical protein WJX72_008506 [[Myrmecia] bisecta]|uniref:Fungal lipase-type domain-containing protein n=1 Tax=[Myrmecia] bisecta TaxID=41462 RepID=A0AAW1Q0Y0_9CHLO
MDVSSPDEAQVLRKPKGSSWLCASRYCPDFDLRLGVKGFLKGRWWASGQRPVARSGPSLAGGSGVDRASNSNNDCSAVPACAPAPSTAPPDQRRQTLISINNQRNSSGPALAKTADAAQYLTAAMYNVSSDPTLGIAPSNQTLHFQGGGRVTVYWAAKNQTIFLAFVDWANATMQQLNTSSDPLMSQAINLVFQGHVVTKDDFDPLTDLLADPRSENLANAISEASAGQVPLRIVCTGYGPSGGVASVAALWAAINYPAANIRLITFGSPQVGGQKFNWAASRLVDLVYLWSIPGDSRTDAGASAPYAPTTGTLSLPSGAFPVTASTVSWDSYLAALNNTMVSSTGPDFAAANASKNAKSPESLGQRIKGFFKSAGDLLDAVSAYFNRANGPETDSSMDNNITFVEAYFNSSCPPVLCKARPSVAASCAVYNSGNGTIAPGSITISNPDTATDLAVAWLPDQSTALIAFQGTTQKRDWLTDFKGWLDADDLAPVVQQEFPQATVHSGFLDSLQSVTTKAPSPEYNIVDVLNYLSGGATPAHILITGHSLGGGLATLAAMWATIQWPEADVTCVTFGSPQTGNTDWARAYRTYVGRQYRFVYKKDVVPALPPVDSYSHVDNGTWAPDATEWILEDRPDIAIDQLNWDDHACEGYKRSLFNVTHVSAPDWVTTAAM